MSYYYNYYLGYKKDGKIYPYAPYDSKGKLACVLSKSKNFASDLHENFRYLKNEEISDELIDSFITDFFIEKYEYSQKPLTKEEKDEYKKTMGRDYVEKEKKTLREAFLDEMQFKYLPISALPTGNYIKEGYILFNSIDDEEYDYWPLLSPHVYAEKLKSGKDEVYDDEGNVMYRISDLIYHKWIGKQSKEYEASIINDAYDNFYEYGISNDEIVVIETEG